MSMWDWIIGLKSISNSRNIDDLYDKIGILCKKIDELEARIEELENYIDVE